MKTVEEKSFPRGGKEPAVDKQKVFKRKRDVSPSYSQSKTTKRTKLKSHATLTEVTLKTIPEGMVILGCIREVNEFELKINLPGRIIGYAPATKISEEYSVYLRDLIKGEEKEPIELSHIFKPGQFVITKVEEISSLEEGKLRVVLSLNPNIIHGDLSYNDVKKDLVIPASVQSIEDHGYVMNCGINGIRAFLNKANVTNFQELWNDGRKLAVGQVLRCLVVKCSTSEGCANVELTADPLTVAYAKTKDDMPLKSIFPGMCFKITVTKVTVNGLIVKFAGDQTGYVHINQSKDTVHEVVKGTVLKGKVLYVEPLTKNVFLTTLDDVCGPLPLPAPFENFRKGHVFKHAKVVAMIGGHLVLELNEDSRTYGYVTIRQMDIESADSTELAIAEQIRNTYPVGSKQKCKVLEYDYMLQKFNCSLKKYIIKQKFTSVDEITPGIVTKCIVEKSTPREIRLKVGGVRGIVEPIQCTDVPVRFPDTLLQKGQTVKAKVLAVKGPICEFTLKPLLVHSQTPILTGFSEAKYDIPYDGVIVLLKPHGILVKFYGEFTCFIPVNRIAGGKKGELEKLYYLGQVVICCVNEIDSERKRLCMSLQPHPNIKVMNEQEEENEEIHECDDRGPIKTGKCYVVYVEDVGLDGLTVREQVHGVVGCIPPPQLSDYPQLAQILCETYSKGDELNVYCLSSGDNPLFTISPTFIQHFESSDGKKITKKGISQLKQNMVLPSTVTEITDEGITVAIPLQGGEHHVSIPKIHICDGTVREVPSNDIQMQQTMMVRLTKVFRGINSEGTTRLSRVWDKALMSKTGIVLLQNYWSCHKRICDFLRKEGHPLGNIEIGSKVKGTVKALTPIGAVLDLNSGVQAVIMPAHYKDMKLKENIIIEGTVIYVDIINQCVEVSLSEALVRTLFESKNLPPIGKTAKSFAYVSRNDIVLCIVQCGKFNHTVGIPSRWHINDLCPSPYYDVAEGGKITIKVHHDGLAIAVPRKVEVIEKQYKERTSGSSVQNGHNSDINVEEGMYKFHDVCTSDFIDLKTESPVKSEVKKEKKGKKSNKNVEDGDGSKVNMGGKYIFEKGISVFSSSVLTEQEKNKSVDNVHENLVDDVAAQVEKRKKNKSKIHCEDNFMESEDFLDVKDNSLNFLDDQNNIVSQPNEFKGTKNKSKKSTDELLNECKTTIVEEDTLFSKKEDHEKKLQKKKKKQKNSKTSTLLETSLSSDVMEKDKEQVSDKWVVSDRITDHLGDASESSSHCTKTQNENKQYNKKTLETSMSDNKMKEDENETQNENKRGNKKMSDNKGKEDYESEKNNANNSQNCLSVAAGFVWDATPDQLPIVMKQKTDDADSSSDNEQEEIVSKKKKQRLTIQERRALARQEEERLRKIEERLMDAERNPESADDFDRLVMSAPNNSQNWIKYMAFHLEATEIAKARAVAERALKTISFREEQEKLNVWVALLNLENLFGTPESLEKTLEEAVKMNDSYKVYLQVLKMYCSTKKIEELDKLVQLLIKKYKDIKDTWIQVGMAYIKCGAIEKSRQIMQRALKILATKHHIEILCRFARMENEWGESERAETILENVITSYPKKLNVWNVYVDMLVKSGKIDIARQVLDRAVAQKLNANKMKSLFQKYLKFEHDHGTNERIEKVREMAKNYVTNLKS